MVYNMMVLSLETTIFTILVSSGVTTPLGVAPRAWGPQLPFVCHCKALRHLFTCPELGMDTISEKTGNPGFSKLHDKLHLGFGPQFISLNIVYINVYYIYFP